MEKQGAILFFALPNSGCGSSLSPSDCKQASWLPWFVLHSGISIPAFPLLEIHVLPQEPPASWHLYIFYTLCYNVLLSSVTSYSRLALTKSATRATVMDLAIIKPSIFIYIVLFQLHNSFSAWCSFSAWVTAFAIYLNWNSKNSANKVGIRLHSERRSVYIGLSSSCFIWHGH